MPGAHDLTFPGELITKDDVQPLPCQGRGKELSQLLSQKEPSPLCHQFDNSKIRDCQEATATEREDNR